jgi:hypothetical protein
MAGVHARGGCAEPDSSKVSLRRGFGGAIARQPFVLARAGKPRFPGHCCLCYFDAGAASGAELEEQLMRARGSMDAGHL